MDDEASDTSSLRSVPTEKLIIEEGKDYLVDHYEQLPYKLISNLGHGHSGNVEEVLDTNTQRVFARKVIRISGVRRGANAKRIFENEIKIIRSLAGHHHVIQVFATYVAKREVGLVLLPVADGGDLDNFLQQYCHDVHEGVQDDAKLQILKRSFGCLASGLAFMHRQKIRHKDIKPRNILIHQGSVVYTDFGCSLDSSMTGYSTTTGRPDFLTRRYSAPEVADFEARNSRSDVFSLGCVFIDILSALTGLFIVDPYNCYSDEIEPLHQSISDSSIEDLMLFLGKCAISMTLRDAPRRYTAGQVVAEIMSHPGLSCNQCHPPKGPAMSSSPKDTDSSSVEQQAILSKAPIDIARAEIQQPPPSEISATTPQSIPSKDTSHPSSTARSQRAPRLEATHSAPSCPALGASFEDTYSEPLLLASWQRSMSELESLIAVSPANTPSKPQIQKHIAAKADKRLAIPSPDIPEGNRWIHESRRLSPSRERRLGVNQKKYSVKAALASTRDYSRAQMGSLFSSWQKWCEAATPGLRRLRRLALTCSRMLLLGFIGITALAAALFVVKYVCLNMMRTVLAFLPVSISVLLGRPVNSGRAFLVAIYLQFCFEVLKESDIASLVLASARGVVYVL